MKDFHYKFGIHSNIPECCVNYYVQRYAEGHTNIGMTFRPEYTNKFWDVAFVTCDECHQKVTEGVYNPPKIHYCNRNDLAPECQPFFDFLRSLDDNC